jgi:hypothetical protein
MIETRLTKRQRLAEAVARTIGVPTAQWPGRCHEIANLCLKAGVTKGRLCYGMWLGLIAETSLFAGRPLARHGWIERRRGEIWDPTRWVFEDADPYIYIGPADCYDFGMNALRAATRAPRPAPLTEEARKTVRWAYLALPPAAKRHVGRLLAEPSFTGALSTEQLHWLANATLQELGPHARSIYRTIVAIGRGVLIPIDNRHRILGAEKE